MQRTLTERIRNAWEGRISGCQLGKPVELLSMRAGHTALTDYLRSVDSWHGRVALGLAGYGELSIDELVERTTRVAETIGSGGSTPNST